MDGQIQNGLTMTEERVKTNPKSSKKLWISVGAGIALLLLSLVIQNNVGAEIPGWARLFTYGSTYIFLVPIYLLFIRHKKVIISNVVLLLLLVLTVETTCFFLLGMPSAFKKQFPIADLPADHIAKQIGTLPYADSVHHPIKMNGTDTVFDVHITIDNNCKRVTPENDSSKSNFALFFGCSICHGEGLEDNQTLPYYFQKHTSNVNAYNFGISGHGTNNVLARLQYKNISEQIPENKGIGIYVFFWDHIYRAIGTMSRYTEWVHSEPFYTMENGKLVRNGNFKEGRKTISSLYEKLYQTNIVKYFKLDLPLRLNDSHIELVTEMILESKKEYTKKMGNDEFILVIYPAYKAYSDDEMKKFKSFLKKKKIQYIDLSNWITYGPKYTLNGDAHPNAQTNELIAVELERRIRLKQFN